MLTKKNLFRRVNKKSSKLNKYLKLQGGSPPPPPPPPPPTIEIIEELLQVDATHIKDQIQEADDEYVDDSTQLTVSDIHMNYIVSNMYVNDFLNCDMEDDDDDEIYRTIKLLTKYPPDKNNGGFTYNEYCKIREYNSIFDEEKFVDADSEDIPILLDIQNVSINGLKIDIPDSFPQDIIYLTGWYYGEFVCEVILLLAELQVNNTYTMKKIDTRINRLLNSFYNSFGIEYIELHEMSDTEYNKFFDTLLYDFKTNYKSLETSIGDGYKLVNLDNHNLIYALLDGTQKYVYTEDVCEPLLEPWNINDKILFDIIIKEDKEHPDIPTIHKIFLTKPDDSWGNNYEINIYESNYNIETNPIKESLLEKGNIIFDIKTVFKKGILAEHITKAMEDEKKILATSMSDVSKNGGGIKRTLKGGTGPILIKDCLPIKKLLYGDNDKDVKDKEKDLDGGKHDVLNRHMLYDGTHDFHTDLKNFTESNNVLPGNFMNAKRKSTTTKCNEALYMYKCLHGEDGYCINNNVPIENGLRVFFDNDFKSKSDDDNLVNMIGTFDMGTHADKSKSFNGPKSSGIFPKDENGKFTDEAFVSVTKVWDSSTGEQITDIYKGDNLEDNIPLSMQAHNLISLYVFWKYWIKQYNIEYYLEKERARIPFLNVTKRNGNQKGKSKLAAYFSVLDFSDGHINPVAGMEVVSFKDQTTLTQYGLKSDRNGNVSLAIDIKEIRIKKKNNSSKQLFNQKLTKQKCWIEFTSWLKANLEKIQIIKTNKLAKKINVDRIINIIMFCVNQINIIEPTIGLRFVCKKRGTGGSSIDDDIFDYLNKVVGGNINVFTEKDKEKIQTKGLNEEEKREYIQKYILIIMVCLIIKHSGDTTQTYLSDICDTFSYSEDQMFICSALLDNNKLITCNQLKRKKDDKSKWPFNKTATTAQETIPIFKEKLGNDTGNINYTMTYQIKSELFEDFLQVQCTLPSGDNAVDTQKKDKLEKNGMVKKIDILNYITGESDSKFVLKSNGYVLFANAVLDYWKNSNIIFNALDISIKEIIDSLNIIKESSKSKKISIFNLEDYPFYVINNSDKELSNSQIDDIKEVFKSDKTKIFHFKINDNNKIEKVTDEEPGTIYCYPLNEKAFKKLFQINNKYSTNNILPFDFSFLKTFKKGNIHTINFRKESDKIDKLIQTLTTGIKVEKEIPESVGRKKKEDTSLKITTRSVGRDGINNFDELTINEYFSYVVSKIVISSIKRTVAINTYCDSNLFVLMEKLIISYTSNIQIYNELHLDKDLKPPADGDEPNFYSECKKIVGIINTSSTGKIYPIHLFFKEIDKFDVTDTNVLDILNEDIIKTWRNDDSSDPQKPKYWTVDTIVNEFNDIKNTVIEFKKIICVINKRNPDNTLSINGLTDIHTQIVTHEIKKKVISIIEDTGVPAISDGTKNIIVKNLPPNTLSLPPGPSTNQVPTTQDIKVLVSNALSSDKDIQAKKAVTEPNTSREETKTDITQENNDSKTADNQVKEQKQYVLLDQFHSLIENPDSDPNNMSKKDIKEYLKDYNLLDKYIELYPDDNITDDDV